MKDAQIFIKSKEAMLELHGLWSRSAPVKAIAWEKDRDEKGEIIENIFMIITFLDNSQIVIRDGQVWIRETPGG
jgi:hypothetical protein